MSAQIDFKTRQRTVWILATVAIGLAAWDYYAAFQTAGAGDTISEVVIYYDKKYPVIRFLAGGLCSHFFWPQIERVSEKNK